MFYANDCRGTRFFEYPYTSTIWRGVRQPCNPLMLSNTVCSISDTFNSTYALRFVPYSRSFDGTWLSHEQLLQSASKYQNSLTPRRPAPSTCIPVAPFRFCCNLRVKSIAPLYSTVSPHSVTPLTGHPLVSHFCIWEGCATACECMFCDRCRPRECMMMSRRRARTRCRWRVESEAKSREIPDGDVRIATEDVFSTCSVVRRSTRKQ